MKKKDLGKAYLDRYRKSAPKIINLFNNKNNTEVPIFFGLRGFWSTGNSENRKPPDYYTNFSSMLKFQEESIIQHLIEIDDDYIPFLHPWYGTGISATGFGCKMKFPEKPGADPFIESPIINDIKDIGKLKMPDPQKDGLMPRVLESIKFMKENSEIPVNMGDSQGPLNTTTLMCGHENLFLWMHDDPKAVHFLFDIVTEAIISWTKVQKKASGEALDELNGTQFFWVPRGVGIRITEDDLVTLGPKQYENFILPCHDRLSKTFGSSIIHFCGDASQHIPVFLMLENLAVINTSTLWKFDCVKKLQDKMRDKIILQVMDFMPVDIKKYYSDLLNNIDLNRVMLGITIEEKIAMTEGGYIEVDIDDIKTAKEGLNYLKTKIKEKIIKNFKS